MSDQGAGTTPAPGETPAAENESGGTRDNASGSSGSSGNQGGNSGGSNSRSGRNNNRSRTTNYVSNHAKNWVGDSEEIGVILGIKPEKLDHQTSVDGLLEKLESHVKKTFDHL